MTNASSSLAKQIALTNLAYCHAQKLSFEIARPHNIRLIEKHINQLDETEVYKAAYVAFMIQKLQPFKYGNTQTAAIIAIQRLTADVPKEYSLQGLIQVLEKGAPVGVIQAALLGKL